MPFGSGMEHTPQWIGWPTNSVEVKARALVAKGDGFGDLAQTMSTIRGIRDAVDKLPPIPDERMDRICEILFTDEFWARQEATQARYRKAVRLRKPPICGGRP